MSYQVHNFKPREALTAQDLNEMDAQIAANAQGEASTSEKVGDAELQTEAQTLSGAVNELKEVTDVSVKFSEQTLTEAQKEQARENIGSVKITDSGLGIIVGV